MQSVQCLLGQRITRNRHAQELLGCSDLCHKNLFHENMSTIGVVLVGARLHNGMQRVDVDHTNQLRIRMAGSGLCGSPQGPMRHLPGQSVWNCILQAQSANTIDVEV